MTVLTHLINMPCSIYGYIYKVKPEPDTYIIFLNAHLSYERLKRVYAHEYTHIINGDFDREHESVQRIEHYAHMVTEETYHKLEVQSNADSA